MVYNDKMSFCWQEVAAHVEGCSCLPLNLLSAQSAVIVLLLMDEVFSRKQRRYIWINLTILFQYCEYLTEILQSSTHSFLQKSEYCFKFSAICFTEPCVCHVWACVYSWIRRIMSLTLWSDISYQLKSKTSSVADTVFPRPLWRLNGFTLTTFGRYDALSVSALVGLVTLTFDFWPWNWCALLRARWATFLPILVFLRLFVFDLWANTCQTHHVTLRPWPLTIEVMALVGDTGLCAPSVYQVWTS